MAIYNNEKDPNISTWEEPQTSERFEDLLPVTYFIRKGGLCYLESSADAKVSGIHIATIANSTFADIITDLINKTITK